MTAQDYLNTYQGQSLLYNTKDPSLRGQCVQGVCFYVVANGAPVIWADAALWWSHRTPKYDYIANTPSAVPQPGDIIVWDSSLPGSGGAGHIAVCLSAVPGSGVFTSVDQNWGGKTIHTVTHNYSYVIGWLRIKGAPAAQPVVAAAPATITQGDEMIADTNQAHEAYQLLRPNGDGNDSEIAATAGRRTWAQFANDAKPELQARNANLVQQEQRINDMQATINSTNQVISNLRSTIANDQVSNADKQKALNDALAQIATDNAQLTTLHDQVTDLQAKIANPLASASAAATDVADIAKQKAGKSGGFLVAFFRFLLQVKVPKILPKSKKS